MRRDGQLFPPLRLIAAGPGPYRLSGNYLLGLENTLCSNAVSYNRVDAGHLKASRSCREVFSSRFSASALTVCGRGPKFRQHISFTKGQIPLEAVRPKMFSRCAAFQLLSDRPEYRLEYLAFAAGSALPGCALLPLIRPKLAVIGEHQPRFQRYTCDLPY